MSDFAEDGRRIPDLDELEDAARERADRVWCKCGNPDLPGTCPGWRNCPMHGEDES